MRSVLGAAVAAFALTCAPPPGVRVDTPTPTESVAPSRAVPRTTASASPGVLALCQPAEVSSTFGQWGAAAGSNVGELVLTPLAGAVCGLPANPTHRLITTTSARVLLQSPPPPPVPTALVPLVLPAGKA